MTATLDTIVDLDAVCAPADDLDDIQTDCYHPNVETTGVTLDGLPVYRCGGACRVFFVFRDTRAFSLQRALEDHARRIRAAVNAIDID